MTEPAGSTDAVSRKSLWLLGFMWVAYVLNYCDRLVVSSLFPVLKSDLSFSDTQLGLTGALFLWVYGLASPMAGAFGDRVSKRLLVVLSLVVWSLVTIVTGMSTSVLMMLVLRAAMGLSEALYMPSAVSLTANAFSLGHRSRVLATLATAQIVGTVVGSWFGGWMGDQGHWRWAFYVLGACGVVFAIPCGWFLRTVDESPSIETKKSASFFSQLNVVKIPTYALLCVAYAVFVIGLWLTYGWLPTFLKEKFQLDLAGAALNATVFYQGTTLLGMIVGGLLADRLYSLTKASRLWMLVIALIGAAPFIYLLGSCETLGATRWAAMGLGFFSGFFIGNANSAAFEIAPISARASAVGVLNLFGPIFSGFGVFFGGVWKESLGIDALLTGAAVLYLLAGLLLIVAIYWFFPRDYARIHEAR